MPDGGVQYGQPPDGVHGVDRCGVHNDRDLRGGAFDDRAILRPSGREAGGFPEAWAHVSARGAQGGVLKRAGHTEATVDLCRLAGLEEVGLCCEIMKEDGTMARMPDLEEFAARHGLKFMTIAQLIAYRRRNERLVEKVEEVDMPTAWGHFRLSMYRSLSTGLEHLALVKYELEFYGKYRG